MLELDTVWAKKVAVYDDVKLKLNEAPLTVIRGLNLDRKSKKSANAVGKSLIGSLIPTIRYFAPPTAVKKKSAKDLHQKGSEIGLKFKTNGHTYEAIQNAKGKSVGFRLLEDGKELKYREKDTALEHFKRLWPMSDTAYYSLGYLDVRQNNPLQRGTDAQRFDFFEDLFHLELYDYIFKELTSEYNRLKSEVSQFRMLQGEKAERERDLPKQPVEILKKKHKKLVTTAKKIQNKVEKRLRELQHLSVYIKLAEGLENIRLDEVVNKLKELHNDESFLQKQYEEAVEIEKKLETFKQVESKKKKILAKLENFTKKYDLKQLQTELDVLKEQLRSVKTELDKAVQVNNQVEEITTVIEQLGLSNKAKDTAAKYNSKTLRAGILRERDRIKKYEESKEALEHNHEASECPVCRSKLDRKIVRRLIEECDSGIEASKARIKKLQTFAIYQENTERLKSLGGAISLASLEKKRKKYQEKIKSVSASIEEAVEQRDLKKQLENLPIIKLSKLERKKGLGGKTSPEAFKTLLNDLRKEIKVLDNVQHRLVELEKLEIKYESYSAAKAKHDSIQSFVSRYKPILDKTQEQINNISSKLVRAETVGNDLKRLSDKISKLKSADEDFKIYDALRRAYGAKGLRKLRIRELAKALEQNLNDFAHLIFGEPIKFFLNVTDTKFDVLASRNNNPPSDVRMLSGSESRAFILLLFLSLIPFVSASKRLNLLILDEMESGLDDHSKRLFVNDFLPELMKIVPHIIIITPQSPREFSIPMARTLTVVKKNGRSIIKRTDREHVPS